LYYLAILCYTILYYQHTVRGSKRRQEIYNSDVDETQYSDRRTVYVPEHSVAVREPERERTFF